MDRGYKKVNIPLVAACILLCLTVISWHMVSGLYAKYTVRGEGGDGARVAVMGGDTTFDLAEEFYIAPGETKEFPITLTNKNGAAVCEVAQTYLMTVENLTNNLELDFTYYRTGGGTLEEVDVAEGSFRAGVEESETYIVKVAWNRTSVPANYAFEMDALRVVVNIEQID